MAMNGRIELVLKKETKEKFQRQCQEKQSKMSHELRQYIINEVSQVPPQ